VEGFRYVGATGRPPVCRCGNRPRRLVLDAYQLPLAEDLSTDPITLNYRIGSDPAAAAPAATKQLPDRPHTRFRPTRVPTHRPTPAPGARSFICALRYKPAARRRNLTRALGFEPVAFGRCRLVTRPLVATAVSERQPLKRSQAQAPRNPLAVDHDVVTGLNIVFDLLLLEDAATARDRLSWYPTSRKSRCRPWPRSDACRRRVCARRCQRPDQPSGLNIVGGCYATDRQHI
jgi:hypothetical protein